MTKQILVMTDNSASANVLINATDITPPPGPQADLMYLKNGDLNRTL